MPKVIIDILEGRSEEHKKALLDAVHHALVEALKIPDDDRIQILNEHKRTHFELPPDKSELYTSIEIKMFAGRSLEAKRTLYRSLATNLNKLGIEPHDFMVILHETAMENWGIRGLPASEINIGFKIDV